MENKEKVKRNINQMIKEVGDITLKISELYTLIDETKYYIKELIKEMS